jgi:hypothetical protein
MLVTGTTKILRSINMFHVTVIKTDGSLDTVQQSHCPELEQLKSAVEGHIESVPHWYAYHGRECVVFCNDDGKWEKPINELATAMWYAHNRQALDDHLCGNIIIVSADTAEEMRQI